MLGLYILYVICVCHMERSRSSTRTKFRDYLPYRDGDFEFFPHNKTIDRSKEGVCGSCRGQDFENRSWIKLREQTRTYSGPVPVGFKSRLCLGRVLQPTNADVMQCRRSTVRIHLYGRRRHNRLRRMPKLTFWLVHVFGRQ